MLKEWDNGGRNVKFDQAKSTDMGSLSRDSALNIAVWGGRKSSNKLLGWSDETWTEKWWVNWKCPTVFDLM